MLVRSIRPIQFAVALALFSLPLASRIAAAADMVLLNVSFDISRELFQQINPMFVEDWRVKTGQTIAINQSHAGSSKQARSVIDGLAADIVTLNQVSDIQAIVDKSHFIQPDWRQSFPSNSSPFSSTIVFLGRKGKAIRDWDDLAKPGVSVIVPNPKTSGNGRYSYLAAYGFGLSRYKEENKAREFVKAIFKNVPVFDVGGRAATTTFVQRELGDVLLAFEAEALLALKESDNIQVVYPSQSIEVEMPVAVVDPVARRHGTQKAARAYLEFLYTDQAQEVIARNYFRPRSQKIAAQFQGQFPSLNLISAEAMFGSWQDIQKKHFSDGGLLDQLCTGVK